VAQSACPSSYSMVTYTDPYDLQNVGFFVTQSNEYWTDGDCTESGGSYLFGSTSVGTSLLCSSSDTCTDTSSILYGKQSSGTQYCLASGTITDSDRKVLCVQ
jgi:hypothetical protein